jgi:hypothetical protein
MRRTWLRRANRPDARRLEQLVGGLQILGCLAAASAEVENHPRIWQQRFDEPALHGFRRDLLRAGRHGGRVTNVSTRGTGHIKLNQNLNLVLAG